MAGLLSFFQTLGLLLKLYNQLADALGTEQAQKFVADNVELTGQLQASKALPLDKRREVRRAVLGKSIDLWARALT